MLQRDMNHYIVINRKDVEAYLNSYGKEALTTIIEGIEAARLEDGKPASRNYVVVSDKRPQLYENVWSTVLDALEKEQSNE